MLKQVIIIFLVANALFWGLATHKQHCSLASVLGVKTCPPHWVHVYVMGLGSFLLALYLRQGGAGLLKQKK